MRVIVLGTGGASRAVLERLGERWDVVVIDPDPQRLDRTREVRSVTLLVSDGSTASLADR